jgi:hypothetical protein
VALPGPLLPLLLILAYSYLGVLVLAPLIIWWQRRRFPVWALLPAGLLTWFLLYVAGRELSRQIGSLHILDPEWTGTETGIVLLSVLLTATLFVALLRGRRIPGSIWLLLGVTVFGNVLVAALYTLARYDGARLLPGVLQYFFVSGVGPVEGLTLVAVGLLAARQHGVLALLVVVGGYGYMCMDSDYLFGHPLREWTGLSAYLVAVTALYLVAVPVALLRAKTRLGRALAVFVPVVAFHVTRLAVPLLVIQQPTRVRPGEIMLSVNVVLSLLMSWVLYSHIGEARPDAESVDLEATPLPG